MKTDSDNILDSYFTKLEKRAQDKTSALKNLYTKFKQQFERGFQIIDGADEIRDMIIEESTKIPDNINNKEASIANYTTIYTNVKSVLTQLEYAKKQLNESAASLTEIINTLKS